jgi:hypothetical protein
MTFQSTFKALKPDDFAISLMQMTYCYVYRTRATIGRS